ncbi:protein phosphatase 2C domain-containing protein [Streptacidiphilus sp. EB103A]|uniref:protein phosphatase 2C domain-containing protein n=1 Tax=Streptacidiphilus sp. EB103A TaxID=3156275 RepID=UPI0035119555
MAQEFNTGLDLYAEGTPTILTGERAGSVQRPSEDLIGIVGHHAVIVLDGVSTVSDEEPRGRWYVQVLGEHLAKGLVRDPFAPLASILEVAIDQVVQGHGLVPGASPAATVAIVRATGDGVDALVLGDSPVVTQDLSGVVHAVTDSRLHALVGQQAAFKEYQERLRSGGGFDAGHRRLLQDLRAHQMQWVNREGGYWIAEAIPEAGRHAVVHSWDRNQLGAVLVATDGVSCAVDEYGMFTWESLAEACRSHGPASVVDSVHQEEAQDPNAVLYPRYKPHDDKALVFWGLASPSA